MDRLRALVFVVCAAALSCPSCAPSNDQATEPSTAAGSAASSWGERMQKANQEVTELMIEADRRRIDNREFRARHGAITLTSVKDFERSAREMEQLARDLRAALGK